MSDDPELGADDPLAAFADVSLEEDAPVPKVKIPVDSKHLAAIHCSAEEVETCIKVLDAIRGDPKLLRDPAFADLRKGVMRLNTYVEDSRFNGVGKQQYKKIKQEKLVRQMTLQRLKTHDKAHINSVKLRSERLSALAGLVEEQQPYDHAKALASVVAHAAAITDGHAELQAQWEARGLEAPTTRPLLTAAEPFVASPASSTSSASASSSSSASAAATLSSPPVSTASSEQPAASASASSVATTVAELVSATVSDTTSSSSASSSSSSSSSSSVSADSVVSTATTDLVSPTASDTQIAEEKISRRQQNRIRQQSEKGSMYISGLKKPAKEEAISDDKEEEEEEPSRGELNFPRSCYVCKKRFIRLHHFYDQLCPGCAKLNWQKRNQMADLRGKVFILTGSRVKIGYECGLRLLRCGATLIATSRFPHDTANRYANEKDFPQWKERLHVFGLDLRDLRSVIRFCEIINARYPRLDGIINNAAQTVRRPPAYYRHLMGTELKKPEELNATLRTLVQVDPHRDNSDLPSHLRMLKLTQDTFDRRQAQVEGKSNSEAAKRSGMHIAEVKDDEEHNTDASTSSSSSSAASSSSSVADETASHDTAAVDSTLLSPNTLNKAAGNISAAMSQVPVAPGDEFYDTSLFPVGAYDVTGQQMDLRSINSWLLLLDQVEPAELLEVFAINTLSPFILNSRLKPIMVRQPGDKWIINVSAMEGKFYRHKGPQHPHTNMAKAALNMMTRTSAQEYASQKIYMNSVDTGWINDENPFERAAAIAVDLNFQTPIDEMDAMARILDPILHGVNTGQNSWGKFLKDFHETEW